MDFHSQLKELGLHDSEIKIYLYLLEFGVSSPPQIAKGTKIARTNSYNILEQLEEKGLIEEQMKGKRKVYLASDPAAFLRALDRKRETVNKLLPDLRALYSTKKNKPTIRFYDGFDQVQDIYLQTLEAEEVYAIGSTKTLSHLSEKFFADYGKKLKEKNIVFHDIVTFASKESVAALQAQLKGLYDVSVMPKENEDVPTDILIWGENIALINMTKPIFGTVLTNGPIAKTFIVLFEMIRENLRAQ